MPEEAIEPPIDSLDARMGVLRHGESTIHGDYLGTVDPDPAIGPPFASDRHALYCGWVAGIAMKHGFDMTIVTDAQGNYTDRFVIHLRPYADITVVVPEPPDEWELGNG